MTIFKVVRAWGWRVEGGRHLPAGLPLGWVGCSTDESYDRYLSRRFIVNTTKHATIVHS